MLSERDGTICRWSTTCCGDALTASGASCADTELVDTLSGKDTCDACVAWSETARTGALEELICKNGVAETVYVTAEEILAGASWS